jgi:hypothetical protein
MRVLVFHRRHSDRGKGISKDPPVTTTILNKKRKIKNAICFFASEHERLTDRPLTRSFLYKYLAFLDFSSLEKTGNPAFGLLYRAMGKGPALVDAHGKGDTLKDECFVLVPEVNGRYVVKAVGKADLGCFSPFELNEMRRLVETYAHQFVRASDTKKAGRETMKFQKQAWVKENVVANCDDVLDHGSFTKYKEVCAMSGIQMLTEKYITQLKELETHMAEIKHKLEVVIEASRLLEEEGLSDDIPPVRFSESRPFPDNT